MSKKPITDYCKALKRVAALEDNNRALIQQRHEAIRERELAERQVRSLTHELQAARREIAALKSLAPARKDNRT